MDCLVCKYSFLLLNQFVLRQNFLIVEVVSRMGLLGSIRTDLFFLLYIGFLNWL